jgi:lysophospholipase L1-like esterase
MPAKIEAPNIEEKFLRACKLKSGPRILTEGDSWFHLPFPDRNIIDQMIKLMPDAAWYRMEWSGDTAANMFSWNSCVKLRKILKKHRFDYVLLSAGGNDLLDGKRLRRIIGRRGVRKANLARELGILERRFKRVLKFIGTRAKVFAHSYDYAIPSDRPVKIGPLKLVGPWIYPAVKHLSPPMQAVCVMFIINELHSMLATLPLKLVDLRGILGSDGWGDELHPSRSGARKLAVEFKAEIKAET